MGRFIGLIFLGLMISSGFQLLSNSIDNYSEKLMTINGFEKVCGEHWYSECEWIKSHL